MTPRRSRYERHRFPPDILSHAVWLYYRYCLSFRDVEDLLAERGIIVSYETIRQWCQKFLFGGAPLLAPEDFMFPRRSGNIKTHPKP